MGVRAGTLLPFLYPCLNQTPSSFTGGGIFIQTRLRRLTTTPETERDYPTRETSTHLNPSPDDFTQSTFADKVEITVRSGSGGNGCVSFFRDKFISDGPANGGDGGTGGNVYIQAVKDLTSLHKIGHKRLFRAGDGSNGAGSSRGGRRGDDVLIQVPIGTVIRELSREDPFAMEMEAAQLDRKKNPIDGDQRQKWRRDQWLCYPAGMPTNFSTADFPPIPRPRRSPLAAAQLPSPIHLDLSKAMETPLLLAAGATGGLGNPHFCTKSILKPKFATRGSKGTTMTMVLELKLLADLGFVGLPNAGKSTLLRALSNSRARVGHWQFTTLHPNMGTVVLDDQKGRAKIDSFHENGDRRTSFTVADIPGIIEDAHQDKGLGLEFLRHIERARILAFVIDLSAGDPVAILQGLWRELQEYEVKQEREVNSASESRVVPWQEFGSAVSDTAANLDDSSITRTNEDKLWRSKTAPDHLAYQLERMIARPWYIVATKSDLPNTQKAFQNLQRYINLVNEGKVEHPSGAERDFCWPGQVEVIPVSALQGGGVDRVVSWTTSLLN